MFLRFVYRGVLNTNQKRRNDLRFFRHEYIYVLELDLEQLNIRYTGQKWMPRRTTTYPYECMNAWKYINK